jgi:hypothetical protein
MDYGLRNAGRWFDQGHGLTPQHARFPNLEFYTKTACSVKRAAVKAWGEKTSGFKAKR